MVERMRGGSSPKTNQNGNGAPQLPATGSGSPGQNKNQPGLGSNPSVSQPGVLSFEQARQQQQRQQQQQRDDSWAQPPPHPSDRRALTPIAERSTRDSNSLDTGGNPPPLQQPELPSAGGPPPQPDQIQKQQSETSQDLPNLQADTESSTFLGEPLVTSPTSHTAIHEFDIGRRDSTGSLGSKPDSHRLRQGPPSPSRPGSKLDTDASTDAVPPAGGSISSPLSSPGKESVFSALPSPYSNQQIHAVQSTFSDIPEAALRNPDRLVTPSIQKDPVVQPGPGSPTRSSPSRFQRAAQRREANSQPNPLTSATKAKTPEPTLPLQTDPHPNSPTSSPAPTTTNSPPTLTHTATTTSTTSKSEHSGYSGGLRSSPPQQMPGMFSSPNHSNRGSYSQPHSHSTSQSERTVRDEPIPKESLSASLSGKLGGVRPVTQAHEGKEGGGGDYDLIEEAGAIYYMQEIQDVSSVPPLKIVGRGQNIPAIPKGRPYSDDDDDEGEELSTEDEPRPLPQHTQAQPQVRQRLPSEPSPLQMRRPSAQASLPPPPTRTSPFPSQNQYQDQSHAEGRDQQPILAPQPQQPVTSPFGPIMNMEGDARSPDLSHPGRDTKPAPSVADFRRTSVTGHGNGGGQGGGSRSGLVSRPSGARDLVMKQRGGTSDSISSHPRHNGQPQPRHPLPPRPESLFEQPSQFSHSTYTQPPHHQSQNFTQTLGETTQQTPQAIGTAGRYSANMANIDQRQHYDDNSDALAALTFLDRDEANAVSKPSRPLRAQERRGPTSGTEVDEYDTPPVQVTPPDDRDDVSQDSDSHEGKYKSSFAPSKQATQRLAKSQAQQAAHQAAVHRPGKSGGANGKGKGRVRQDGWAESSEEEEEEEDDEDVDSDGDPVAPKRQGPVGSGQNFGKLSAQGSPYGSTTDLHQFGQGRPQRHLPRPPSPGRAYGMYSLCNI